MKRLKLLQFFKSNIFTTRIVEKKQVAEGTSEISLRRPRGFEFKAGQYIQVSVKKILHPDPKGSSRVFSIASSPNNKKLISITFRDSSSGFKQTLKDLPIGSEVLIEGPHGYFTLPKKVSEPIVFVAGGIGITPYLSMTRFAIEKKMRFSMILIYTNKNKKSSAYLDELKKLADKNTNFTLKTKFSRATKDFIEENVKNPHSCVWHIAGPPGMVDSARNMLFLMGVDDKKICFEEFVGY